MENNYKGYFALLISVFILLCGLCLIIGGIVFSQLQTPPVNEMQLNYMVLYEEQIQITEWFKQELYACVVNQTDTQTKVTLLQ